uniref:Fibronectin type-III domain-containing protein n=1 Tax=viral metagenome TaxID=1070528 RepID=A0A6C0JND7_9ZZZZ
MPITDISYNYITVSFNAPVGSPPIRYYGTAIPSTNYNKQTIITTPSQNTNTPMVFSGLVSGTTYTINITSVYSIGNVSSGNILATTTYAAPTNLSIINPTINSLTVGYTPPLGSTPIGYYATAVPNVTDNGQTIVNTSQTTATLINISNLVSGTLYNIYVNSVYDNGYASSTVSQGATLSNPPTNLIISDISYSYLKVGYTISNGSTALGYYATATNINNGLTISSNTSFLNPLEITGLISGTTYNVTITGVYSSNTTTSNYITVNTPSKQPVIIGINDFSYNFLTVSFNEPVGNTPNSYYATATPLNTNNYQQTKVSDITYTTDPIRISGLISGTIYSVAVSAIFNNGTVTSSSILGNTTAIFPTRLSVTNPTLYSLTVGYTPPISSPPIGYYAIATPLTIDNGQTIVNTSITTSTLIVISGLISGTIYNISVSAVYNTGNLISTTTAQGITLSYPPSGLISTGSTLTTVSIQFNAPSGNTPIGYYATAYPNQTNNGQIIKTTRSSLTNNLYLTIPDLISGTNYTVYSYSVYSNGDLSSNSVIIGTLSYPPTNLQFVIATPFSITISFTPPLGTLPESYTITTAQGGSGTALRTATSITINGLTPSTTYSGIILTAIYSSGNSSATMSSSQSTIGLPVTNLTVTDVSINYITLSFTPDNILLPDNYTIASDQGGSGFASKTSASITMNGLIPNTQYTNIAITSVYINRGTSVSNSINYYTLGYNTTGLITTPNLNSIDVSFNSPIQSNPPIGYFLTANPLTNNNEQRLITHPVNVSTTNIPTSINTIPITIPGLISGTTYVINVNTVYQSGNVISYPITSYTLSNSPTISRLNSTVGDASTNAIKIYFNAPSGSLPLSYSITVRPQQIDNGQDPIPITISGISRNDTSYNFKNLISGSTYDISMSAIYNIVINSTGYIISGNTLSTPPTLLSLNSNLNDASTNAITVYFNPPIGSLPLSYSATANPKQLDNSQNLINITGISRGVTSYTFKNLIPGTTYDISMAAIYDISVNSTSNFLTGNTLIAAPTLIAINSSQNDASTNSITVYFNSPVGGLPINYSASAIPRQNTIGQLPIPITGITRGATSYKFENLISGTTYDISLSAIYNTNTISTSNFLTGNTLSRAPTLVSLDIGTISTDPRTITVNFTPPVGSLPISYSATATPEQYDNGQQIIPITGISRGSTSYTFNNLISGTTYDISMAAVYDISINPTTNFLIGSTIASVPLLGTLTTVNETALNLTWSLPFGTLPRSYSLTANPKTRNNSQELVPITGISRGSTTYVINNLISGTTYDVSLSAVYSNTTTTSTSFLTLNTLSSYPTINNISNQTVTTLTVNFTKPTGSLPISYSLTANPQQKDNSQEIINVTGISRGSTTYIINGLKSGTTYDISMASVYDVSINSTPTITTSNTASNPPTLSGINLATITDPSTNAITVYFKNPIGSLPKSYLATITPQTSYNSQTKVTTTTIPINDTLNDVSFSVTGLVSGTRYDVSMAAVYSIVTNRTTGIVSGNTLANQPTILSVSNNNTDNRLSISYLAPSVGSAPIGYYTIATPLENFNNQQTITIPSNPSVTSFTNNNPIVLTTNIISGTTYRVVVGAIYDTGNQISSEIQGNSLSSLPTNLNVTSTTSTTFSITFNPPSGSAPKYYYAKAVPGSGTTITTLTGASTSINISGLSPATFYTITAYAGYNSNTTSVLNSFTTTSGTTYGLPPTALSTTSATATSVTISYTPPSTIPLYYSITAATTGSNTYGQGNLTITSASPTYTISNLFPGTAYIISVSAVYSTNIASTGTVNGNTLSNAATSLLINNISYTSFDVSFSAPTNSLTNPNQLFNVFASPSTTSRGQQSKTIYNYAINTISSSGINVNGLTSGTQYTVYVYSIYDTGNIVSIGITTNTLIVQPSITITNDVSYSFITANITSGYTPINYYVSYNTSTNSTYVNTNTQGDPIFKITGLNAGTSYNIKANATYDTGVVSSSDISGNTTALPVNITNINKNFTALTVSFSVPIATPIQSIPTGYYAVATPDGATSVLGQQQITTNVVSSSNTSLSINGLTSGTIYNCGVYSVFPNTSVVSSSSSVSTLASPPVITTTSVTATSITVNFNSPISTGPIAGDGIKYYAQLVRTSDTVSTDTSISPTTNNSITISSLLSGISYNVFVYAVYGSTNARASFASNPVTTTVNPPTNIYNANNILTTSLSVGFTPPNGTRPDSYNVYAYTASDSIYNSPKASTSGSIDPPVTLTNLSTGTTYQIRVDAIYGAITASSSYVFLVTHL